MKSLIIKAIGNGQFQLYKDTSIMQLPIKVKTDSTINKILITKYNATITEYENYVIFNSIEDISNAIEFMETINVYNLLKGK